LIDGDADDDGSCSRNEAELKTLLKKALHESFSQDSRDGKLFFPSNWTSIEAEKKKQERTINYNAYGFRQIDHFLLLLFHCHFFSFHRCRCRRHPRPALLVI